MVITRRLLKQDNLYRPPSLKYLLTEEEEGVELLQLCFILSSGPLEVCEYSLISHLLLHRGGRGRCFCMDPYGETNSPACLSAFDPPVTLSTEAEWMDLVYIIYKAYCAPGSNVLAPFLIPRCHLTPLCLCTCLEHKFSFPLFFSMQFKSVWQDCG